MHRDMYRVVRVIENSEKGYEHDDYKELLGEDEEDAVHRWANIMNYDTSLLSQKSSGTWDYNGDRVNVELFV